MDDAPTPAAVEAHFDIEEWEEVAYEEPDDGPRLTRISITKRYHGVIDGAGTAEVLTTQGENGSGYVASERIVGRLEGRRGSFVIQHGGLADGPELSTFGRVVPGSGTGELVGLGGQATEGIEGVLSLSYTLS